MKKIFVVLIFFLVSVNCFAGRPQYVFNDMETAEKALTFINQIADFPNRPYYKGGKVVYNQAVTWAEIRIRATDNKPYFERLPMAEINKLNQATIEYFLTKFPHVIEEFDESWNPYEEELK